MKPNSLARGFLFLSLVLALAGCGQGESATSAVKTSGVAATNGSAPPSFNEIKDGAARGDAKSEFNLGLCYARGDGVMKDEAGAVIWFRKAAEQNDADAQFYLGACYSSGFGVAKDEVEAVKWYRKAADQQLAIAHIA